MSANTALRYVLGSVFPIFTLQCMSIYINCINPLANSNLEISSVSRFRDSMDGKHDGFHFDITNSNSLGVLQMGSCITFEK